VKVYGTKWVGNSQASKELFRELEALRGQTHLNVLILGESGTGKEIVASLLNEQETTGGVRPFVVTNMPAIPGTLLESELFGVERGAFTDAKISRAGKFELANRGDIFLDEIGDLPFEMQSKLLRTLQEQTVERVGSLRKFQVKFRTISATNRPLDEMMRVGTFREDLFYRLSDAVLHLPPLRERKEDIPLLLDHFLRKFQKDGFPLPRVSEDAIQALMSYSWPGNVRQLESTVKRSMLNGHNSEIRRFDIYDPANLFSNRSSESRESGLYEAQTSNHQRELIQTTLLRCGGSRLRAMKTLGLSKSTFYRKLNDLKIKE
jgi:Nif-specific regulatory protein